MNTTKNTDDIYPDTPTIPRPEPEATRFVDVHVYTLLSEQDEQEIRTIEATLDEISNANQPPDEDDEQSIQPKQPQPGRTISPFVSIIVGIVLLALLGKGYLLYLLPMMTPTITITIVPVSTHIQTTATIQIMTTTAPDSSKDQIAGRLLSSLTITQAQTILTTGKAYQQATAATGMITFYNAAPYAQTIPAGMVLTGKSGREYSVDQAIEVPAVTYPTLGQATGTAHSLTIGTAGNEPAGDIYGPCCLLNLSAVGTAFTGGQDAREYQSVSTQDISTTASSLQTSLTASVRSALQTQLHAGETMLEPVCTPTTTSDHKAGDEATSVTVTINETCSGIAYQTTMLHDAILHAINQQAALRGKNYTPTGDLAISIKEVHTNDQGTATMQVVGRQTYSYQFSQQEQENLKKRIAGKGREEATTLLLHSPGVQTVSINGSDPGMTSIPTESSSIHFLFLIG